MENKLFNELKKEVARVIQAPQTDTTKVIIYLNKVIKGAESNYTVINNFSIASFKNLILNSDTFEDFKSLLKKLPNQNLTIITTRGLTEAKEFNENEGKDIDYEFYRDYLNSAVALNNNLYYLIHK